MTKEDVKIEFDGVEFPYKKIDKDVYLTVNGKEVKVYVNILRDEAEREYELEHEICLSDAEELTPDEYEAVKEWCNDQDMMEIGMCEHTNC